MRLQGAIFCGLLGASLQTLLCNDSFHDIEERGNLFSKVFRLCRALAAETTLVPACYAESGEPGGPESGPSVFRCLEALEKQAEVLLGSSVATTTMAGAPGGREGLMLTLAQQVKEAKAGLVAAGRAWQKLANRYRWDGKSIPGAPIAACQLVTGPGGVGKPVESVREEYLRTLRDLAFRPITGLAKRFSFKQDAAQALPDGGRGGRQKERMRRLLKEIATLRTSLPVDWETSVFVVCDEDQADCLRAMVLPPADTPYGLAPFFFDVFCPADYPARPPRVKFLTTGGGRVRFNPNLYENGKVCLSLLGTWSGPSWDPKNSTLLQVFLSLQSMIFISEPYFNEPGYESTRTNAHGIAASESYSAKVRGNTLLHALLPALKAMPSEFEAVLRPYFALRRADLEGLAQSWARHSVPSPAHNMVDLATEVSRRLAAFRRAPETFDLG